MTEPEFKEYVSARRVLASDRLSASLFLHKMQEFEAAIREERAYAKPLYVALAHATGVEETHWRQWAVTNSKVRLEDLERQWRKFNMLHETALGRKKQYVPFDLEAIKQTPIEEILGTSIVGTRSKLRQYFCPFHQEKTPSFTWYTKNNSWYCFSCQIGGDVIALYQKLNNCTFVEACKALS